MSLHNKYVNRSRASTRAILGSDYIDDVTEVPQLLIPERNEAAYTEERLKRGLTYADRTLRNSTHKVSPITSHMLLMYKVAVKDLLEKQYDNDTQKKPILVDVMAWERSIATTEFLRNPADDVETGLMERLTLLRRYEFAARYGDYTKDVCEKLKMSSARESRTQYFEEIHGWNKRWTDINEALNRQRPAWIRWTYRDASVNEAQIKTTIAVEKACIVYCVWAEL